MSTDGSTAGQVNASIVDDGSSSQGATAAGAGTSTGGKCQMPLTPRFTQEEKEILYSLFHQHEDVIDIKFRKKNRSKYSVRDAWEQIVRDFNSHPNVSAMRNLKQIQKFWLNARLRKQYPFRSVTHKQQQISADNQNGQNGQQNSGQQQQQQQQQQQLVNHTIKTEPEFTLNGGEANDNNDQSESYEEMEMDGSGVTELEEDPLETQQQHQQSQHQQLQQVVPTTAIHTQHINVDQISADKLTLTDLLHFKSARPREDIILQIKHPGEATAAQITLPSPTRITIPTHQQQHTMATITANGYNQQIISEIKPQQITLAQYQAQQQLQQQQQQQQVAQQQQQLAQQAQLAIIQQQQQHQQAAAVVAAAAVQQQQHQQVKMQLQTTPAEGATQFATATPTFTCTTFSALPTAAAVSTGNTNHVSVAAATAPTVATITTAPSLSSHNNVVGVNNVNNSTNTSNATQDPYEEKINYFKMKEAELRYKEQQVALEKKKIELSHTQDQLKHLREVHRLQVEELKVKIRILQEEEKQLLKAQSPLSS